jgi:hypothetical protein
MHEPIKDTSEYMELLPTSAAFLTQPLMWDALAPKLQSVFNVWSSTKFLENLKNFISVAYELKWTI